MRVDFTAGADSVGFSLHKFLATRMPAGMVITRHSAAPGIRMRVPYTGAADTTITCSRNAHVALMAWLVVRRLGVDGLRHRAEQARSTAAYLEQRLTEMSWPAWRHPYASTVVLRTPPRRVAADWQLSTIRDGWSHYICLPGRGRSQADRFLHELATAQNRMDNSWAESIVESDTVQLASLDHVEQVAEPVSPCS